MKVTLFIFRQSLATLEATLDVSIHRLYMSVSDLLGLLVGITKSKKILSLFRLDQNKFCFFISIVEKFLSTK